MTLSVKGVTKRFGGLVAVDDVSIQVDGGQIHGLIGPNGAGKSTLIGIIAGTVLPDEGAVHIGDTDLTYRRAYEVARSGIARTYQAATAFPTLSVAENLWVAKRAGTKSKQTRLVGGGLDRVLGILELDMDDQRLAGALSYGEVRRLSLAMAIASEPQLLLLDEPVAGLNREESQRMGEVLQWCVADLGLGVLLVEHDIRLVMEVSDHVTVLDQGAVLAAGAPRDVRTDERVIAVYLGEDASKGGGL